MSVHVFSFSLFPTSEAFTGSSGFTATVKVKITHKSEGLKGQTFS